MLHDGGIPGVSSLVTLFPDAKFGIVQLANADSMDAINIEIMSVLANAVLGTNSGDGGLAAK